MTYNVLNKTLSLFSKYMENGVSNMIFRSYQDIARQALRLNDYKPHVAAADIGVHAAAFTDVLTGGYPDLITLNRFIIYKAYLDLELRQTALEAVA